MDENLHNTIHPTNQYEYIIIDESLNDKSVLIQNKCIPDSPTKIQRGRFIITFNN